MRLDVSKFSSFVKQVLFSAENEFIGDVNTDTMLYVMSLMPQFDIAFDGDKRIFKSNMEEVIAVYEHRKDREPSDKEYINIDAGLKIILSNACDIASVRGSKETCLADVLLSCREDYPDLLDYIALAGGDLDTFIDNMFTAESIHYCVDDFDEENAKELEHAVQSGKKGKNDWTTYCKDLLEECAVDDKVLVGRESELAETIRILCRKEKANPLHIGDAGVGKTEITLGLCRKILRGDVPAKLKGSRVFSLDLGALLAGTQYRGDMEERLCSVVNELEKIAKGSTVILYIDEIHMICGAGRTDGGSMDVANIIKPLLTKSVIKVIGATTYEDYKQYVEKDKALGRRFKLVTVVEPTPDEAKLIMRGLAPSYEEFHHVKYDPTALDRIVDLTVKYVHDKRLPDKAIDIMDEVGANLSQNYKDGDKKKRVTVSMIEKVIAQSYNIPKETVETDEISKLKYLEDKISESLFGQDEAIKACVNCVKLNRLGLGDANKPVANLLFVGQTGVGKTELAIQLANSLGIDFVRFDMSEYSDEMSVTKLIGASAGYVGYEDGGLLVEQIRKHPHCVLLLDEIEKANSKVFSTLLQVMDNATLTDNKGRVADFKNVILIMTSNAGAADIVHTGMGYGSASKVVDFTKMDKAVNATFTPEFRNRLTATVKFNSMSDEMAEKVVIKHLDSLLEVLESKGVKAKYDGDVVKFLKKKGITPEYGARELLRVINSDVKLLFVDYLLEEKSGNVAVKVDGDKLVLSA